ncbi:sugar 3,4-ketoisomerase [Algoriphagus mannitolivorans]|uniref:sugar 3,4-ketoisomerase n=1 Tax=Algoriphagus mannitolivorans TaxID=226504 RepID=UPI000427B0F6|nr:FdtA/QdtA family cupin domain-containing protein [Algoriphagus mannitolivorans]
MIIPDSKDPGQHFRKAELITLPGTGDALGKLHFWENKDLFPRGILRCFWITEVKEGLPRGSHAHYLESQVLVALAGKLKVRVEGLDQSVLEFELSKANYGVYVPPMNWVDVWFEDGAVLLGLSDREFSENDYIRDKGNFESLQKNYR